MPIGAWAHAQYWRFSNGAGPQPGGSAGVNGYIPWQMNTVGSLFGGLQAWYERLRTILQTARRIHQLSKDRQLVVWRVCTLLESPDYAVARESVTGTARALGFNDPSAWMCLKRTLQAQPQQTENMYRHLEAIRLFDLKRPEALSNPDKHLLVELAYHGYAADPQRTEAWRSTSPISA